MPLIGSIGRKHRIYRDAEKKWRCSCPRGEPANAKRSPGDPHRYPCPKLVRFWSSVNEQHEPPPEMVFTIEGAREAIEECTCLSARGVELTRAQVPTVRQVTRPPAETGRNKPCPCGSGGKAKRCCMWKHEPEETRGERLFFPPGGVDWTPGGITAKPEEPEDAAIDERDVKRRERIIALQERRAATNVRIDQLLVIERARDEATRMMRRARELVEKGEGLFDVEAGDLRARAGLLREEAKLAKAAMLEKQAIERASARIEALAKRRARYPKERATRRAKKGGS